MSHPILKHAIERSERRAQSERRLADVWNKHLPLPNPQAIGDRVVQVALELRLPIEEAIALEEFLKYARPLLITGTLSHRPEHADHLISAVERVLARLIERNQPFDQE